MPALVIRGASFKCRDTLPQWRLMELASAMRSNQMAQMAGMHDFVLAMLRNDEERERFVVAMRQLEDDDSDPVEELNLAIGALMESYAAPAKGAAAARPTKRSSASPSGPKPTGGTSRVVSLQRGTVKEEPTSATGGTSVAS